MAMGSVTIDRVAMVQADILGATLQTSSGSTLSAPEQDRLLAQGCAEACDLLRDWLASGWFGQLRPAGDGLLADAVPTTEQFTQFLGPIFGDALTRAARAGIEIDPSSLQDARAKVAGLARRHRRMRRPDLVRAAEERVGTLRDEVCRAAAQLKKIVADGSDTGPAGAAWRQKAQRTLKKVAAFLPTVALTVAGAMLSAGPHEMAHSVSEWAHEAATVVVVCHIADLAQPAVRIAPPRSGPLVH
jgi:hypothetical protein